ncbi:MULTISPECIES: hypothetical protein [unclassified Streptomyces]|uniref:hypothetical protein n=1 Tax=unclassified Streptomyces TaxID=2593676 RepID=UPI00071337C1|nr:MULTISPECIES: hypothetical protein [unclassified Streptomyces]KQZ09952.1 hypothetical protein ASD51_34095 [Streptomyces sp. Root55]
MSGQSAERRADQAAAAEQRRIDRAAADQRRADRERAADDRAARLREQQRLEQQQQREQQQADQERRRTVRAARRSQSLTAGNVYRKGTLALVAASALGSLPAQVLHFVHISPMLLPLPLAIEGAAWVMAAGVAYADERQLPAWVRWLLRVLVAVAAGFAAYINYGYGRSLEQTAGLSAADAQTAGIGLAAVTLLGPLLFEIRQWVSTLSATAGGGEQREQQRHARRRRRDHRTVAKLADRLLSAAPFGSLTTEDAWKQAWEIVHGSAEPGMTPKLHRYAVRSATSLAAARRPSVDDIRERISGGLRDVDWVLPTDTNVVPIRRASSQVAAQMPPSQGKGRKAPAKRPTPPRRRKGDTPRYSVAARVVAADTARRATVSAQVGANQ